MEQATNLFTKGLLLDTHPMVLSNDTLTDCLNGTLITMNGNEVILQNDMGNRRVDKAFLPPGYEPVGIKEYGGIIYVASYNPITNKSLIGSFPSPLKKLSSNTNGEAPIFDFLSFTSNTNTETDSYLGITVLKSDSFMLPLTKDLALRAGDKFAVYAKGLSDPEIVKLLTNYNNVDNRFPNKAYTPKNRKYTLQLGVLNSQNEFVDITKTLCRWKNIGTTNSPNWQPVNYTSDVSEIYKFNDGYFISDAFTNTFDENTIADAKLIKERQKIAANTYAYKLVGPLYLKVTINHIENFNYNIYGIYDNGEATLWIEGYLTYNCPDGASTITGINSNENYGTFDEGIPSTSFGFDLSSDNGSFLYSDSQIDRSVYNPNNNTYTVKIVKKYEHVKVNGNSTIFNYVLGVKADIDNSGVYLRGLSVKGSIDLSLLGSGLVKFNGWRFYNDFEKQTSLLTFAFNAYPEYGKSFTNLKFVFREIETNKYYYYPNDEEQPGLPVYNGKQTLSFGWKEIGLEPRKTYIVQASYIVLDSAGYLGDPITISEDSIRWFLTTELFNEFFSGSSGIADYCTVPTNTNNSDYILFNDKMKVTLKGTSNAKNLSNETLEMEGSLIQNYNSTINYLCKHIYNININTNTILEIKDENLYPDYIKIKENKKEAVLVDNVLLSSIENTTIQEVQTSTSKNYSSSLRNKLLKINGINLDTTQSLNPEQRLEESTLLESSIDISGKNVGGKIIYYDLFKANGETINTISNAFDKFSTILDLSHVLPSSGYYGGVIVNFDDIIGGQDGHFIDVAINLDSDKGDLPGDSDLKNNWFRVKEVYSDITESDKYNDANWSISDYLGSIFLYFNDSVKDSDKTFLYYFCENNKYNPSSTVRYGYNGKNGAAFTRAWWKMPNGEWACFRSLYKRGTSFADFIKSQLGNKDLIYCMYEEYSGNDFIYAPKENYIYYDRYNVPITYTINYKLLTGETVNSIIDNGGSDYRCGNLIFSNNSTLELSPDNLEFNLISSEKFYDNIKSVDSENISNVFIDRNSSIAGERYDSMGRLLNPNYVYHLDNGKLHRIDSTNFYVDSVNKTGTNGANRLLYNINRKSSVEDKCQVTDGNDEDSYTRLTYNSLNVVVSV